MEVVQEDCGDGSMLCTDHPYKNNTPGGICAFCLQEKLGKLVSSSFPITIFPSSSSSSSPSFRSDNNFITHPTSSIVPLRTHTSSSVLSNTQNECHRRNFNISKIPYLLTHKKKKKESSMTADHNNNAMIFKRSKSTVTPRRGVHFNEIDDFGSNKRRFWSFRHLNKHLVSNKEPEMKEMCYSSSACAGNMGSFAASRERSLKKEEVVIIEENDSPDQVTFDRKVSRSRSVGCGSRSFSGDIFDRISTGFGDCTLRRVESQREGKSRTRRSGSGAGRHDTIKERVKCGGLFSGFMPTSSSSSSSSSSYWVSSSTEDNHTNANVKPTAAPAVVHGRSKSWGWAFASPMRAFNKPTSAKRDTMSAANRNLDPNLAAMPSLLAMRS